MTTIQVVMDEGLLSAADAEAERKRTNRSSLLREALRHYLAKEHRLRQEEQERLAYVALPDEDPELEGWTEAAVWPES
jgi:metal-responsive CopG/Arc/MetJ family transcriptional regulator